MHRAKVLSSSRLRGVVLERLDDHSLRVDARWGGHPGLVEGLEIRVGGALRRPRESGDPAVGGSTKHIHAGDLPLRRPRESGDPAVGGSTKHIAAGDLPLRTPRESGDPAAGSNRIAGFDLATGILTVCDPLPPVDPGDPFEIQSSEEAPILAARIITGVPAIAPLPPMRMRLATTRGTNALLTRGGGRVALFVTVGHRDLLTIGTQQRPDLFALRIRRPEPLTARVVEVQERLSADGGVLIPLDVEAVRRIASDLVAEGTDTAAVALLHAYRNPEHERAIRDVLLEAGFRHVSLSSELSRTIGILDRARTAVTNAYLSPALDGYLDGVLDALDSAAVAESLLIMTSAGGLVPRAAYNPKDSLLSGPAGGVVGAADAGRAAGFDRIISFDMGGTSTDVARVDGDFDYTWRHRVGDGEVLAPALAIESVAAGGGSICDYGSSGLTVGPDSAGASPGPACYGAGGPLTITDCNLLLGRLHPDDFEIPISVDAAERALDALIARIVEAGEPAPGRTRLLEGLLDIANEKMADAIRGISLRKGYDPADYALVVFGGAGAQHGCGVATRLGITTIVVPPDPGLLSARGLGAARRTRIEERQLLIPLSRSGDVLDSTVRHLEDAVLRAMGFDGIKNGGGGSEGPMIDRRVAELRLEGQNTTLSIDLSPGIDLREAFDSAYRTMYGHPPPDKEVEIESVRVIARAGPAGLSGEATRSDVAPPGGDRWTAGEPAPAPARTVRLSGEAVELPVVDRNDLSPGGPGVAGPALLMDPYSTIVVEPDWIAGRSPSGAVVLRRSGTAADMTERHAPAVVRQQLFTARFEAIVEQMGEQLRRTSLSTNVKERLDFSCALLSPAGELIANAPHIPVHLGALGVCVRAVAATLDLRPGDVVITNHPAFGGSHLPDVTLVTPVHDRSDTLLGYVANRAHHAEIGGSRPGSMPPDASSLAEEGVVIPPTLLVEGGFPRWDEIGRLFRSGPYPSRAPDENLADLRGQLAANHLGASQLLLLADCEGASAVLEQMEELAARSERLIRRALQRFEDRELGAVERLDDGTPIEAMLRFDGGRVTIDFTGSGPVHSGNLNATPAIVRSAVLYVLRLLVDEPVPLNEGLLRPVEIIVPESLLNPAFAAEPANDPAVVGGNTEVSQRLVDTLVRALGLLAGGQGTMNNVLWGTSRFGYYETIGGGSGAGAGFVGMDGVHVHMTNTRMTDSEVLEQRYPVRVRRFTLRRGSGGGGAFRGGDGIVREIEFLEPMSLSLLSQHRVEEPYGMEGGEPGSTGHQYLVRADGNRIALKGIDAAEVGAGDRLIIETPGGGGWGTDPAR